MSNGVKVLLCDDVKDLGWLGDIVEVAAGYARNFLIPQGLAKLATKDNIRALAQEKVRRSEVRIQERSRLEKAAAAVDGAEAVLAAKANELGHLFGSVGAVEIAGNLREQGFEVAEEIVVLEENIKEVGTSQVILRFSDELTATVSVVVVAEGADLSAQEPSEAEAVAEKEQSKPKES